MGKLLTHETHPSISPQGNGIQQIQSQSMDGGRTMGVVEEPYNWERDAISSYTLAIRMIALRIGSRRFKTLPEMYWQEQHGTIP
jgi:hypothetical protein